MKGLIGEERLRFAVLNTEERLAFVVILGRMVVQVGGFHLLQDRRPVDGLFRSYPVETVAEGLVHDF